MRSRIFLFLGLLCFSAGLSPLAASDWVSLGPFGASVEAVTVDPTNAQVVYITLDDHEGVYKSSDGGGSWSRLSPLWASGGVAIDPSHPSTLYVSSFGIEKSVDGGQSWTELEVSDFYYYPYALAVDPVLPSRIYAGTTSGGILHSLDGGVSWIPSRAPLPDFTYVHAMVASRPRGRVFALTYGHGLFRSTDGGASWSLSEQGLPPWSAIWSLAVDPANPQKVYPGFLTKGPSGPFPRFARARWDCRALR